MRRASGLSGRSGPSGLGQHFRSASTVPGVHSVHEAAPVAVLARLRSFTLTGHT